MKIQRMDTRCPHVLRVDQLVDQAVRWQQGIEFRLRISVTSGQRHEPIELRCERLAGLSESSEGR